jgi:hypothetical protein
MDSSDDDVSYLSVPLSERSVIINYANTVASLFLTEWQRVDDERWPKIRYNQGYLREDLLHVFQKGNLVDLSINVSNGKIVVEHCPYWSDRTERTPYMKFVGYVELSLKDVSLRPYSRKDTVDENIEPPGGSETELVDT